jgi:hypothetical protein
MKIPCLSLWQPWATACVRPLSDGRIKSMETRFWRYPPRAFIGKYIVIHAAKHYDREVVAQCQAFGLNPGDLPFGAAVGMVYLRGSHVCTERDEAPALCECVSKLGLEFAQPREFPRPIPMVGHQGFWYDEIPDELMPAAVRDATTLYRC